jgi:predicted ATPase
MVAENQEQADPGTMIDELKIENFRSFTSLELKGLKRVNLVVGENNSGKTSLLEAFFLLSNPANVAQMANLFRPSQGSYNQHYFRWLLRDMAEARKGTLSCKVQGSINKLSIETAASSAQRPGSRVMSGAVHKVFHDGGVRIASSGEVTALNCRTISVHHRQPELLVPLFGKIQRKSGGEETLQRLLSTVDPRIKKIRIDPGDNSSSSSNQLILDVGLSELIPLTQAGQGIYRLVSILSDIIGESPDVLLVDEIENGLHHSVQQQIWAGLAEAAEKLGVQIFATTHSDECLRAAHAAFQSRSNYDFSVIQLFRVPSGVQGRVLDQEHIEASIAGNIDLR